MGAGVLSSDYESEDLHSDGQGLTESESESDGNNAEVDANADVESSAGVYGRRPRFKEAMTDYVVEGEWGIKFVKNDKVRVRAVCQEGCKFVSYLTKLPRELTFQLKTLQLKHSCSRCYKSPRMTAKFLAKKLVGRVKDQPDIKLRSIQKKVHKKYVTHISQSKAYRAKAKVMDILEGSHIEQYNMLWDYCEELRRSNPGSTMLMKGLVQCFETAFPTQEHRSCYRHIYNNLKRRHPGILIKELFWRAAQATYIQEFEKVMSELKEVDVGAHKWLDELPLKTWTRSKFTGNAKSDALLNNMCECFNKKIIEAREKSIISLVEDIRLYLMRRFQYNREGILKFNLSCVKDFFESFTVDLNEKSCTCQRWKLTGITCSHAITCIHYNKEEVDNYVDDCYKVPAYKTCYERMILPINESTMWAKTGLPPVKPPHLRRT
ncbi:hypothetical protein FCV25MIE_07772 [Fagus crenata]